MNEYNHHRILKEFARQSGIDDSVLKILIEASDFSDDIDAKKNYFFYHFYYDIETKSNSIQLNRVDEDAQNNFIDSMKNCDSGPLNTSGLLAVGGEKKEFYSLINKRGKSPKYNILDIGNQSDNVSFLHAMGAKNESHTTSLGVFMNHLVKCFSEFLFLNSNEKNSLFMLGIAFHGIMDSFTPSHTNFQKYPKQRMALHAQGDVIPIKMNGKEEEIYFDPGQFKEEKSTKARLFARYIKGYDDNEEINSIESQMLRIFFVISDIRLKSNINQKLIVDDITLNSFSNLFLRKKKSEINDILKKHYIYGNDAYVYAENAITVLKDIYEYLSEERIKCRSYNYYKRSVKRIASEAFKKWYEVYHAMYTNPTFIDFQKKQNLLEELFANHWYNNFEVLRNLRNNSSQLVHDTAIDILTSEECQEMLNQGKESIEDGLVAISYGIDAALIVGQGLLEKEIKSILEIGSNAIKIGQDALDACSEFVFMVIKESNEVTFLAGEKALSLGQKALDKGQLALEKGKEVITEIGKEKINSIKGNALTKFNEALTIGLLALEKGNQSLNYEKSVLAKVGIQFFNH